VIRSISKCSIIISTHKYIINSINSIINPIGQEEGKKQRRRKEREEERPREHPKGAKEDGSTAP
jgi:hypothetical protein